MIFGPLIATQLLLRSAKGDLPGSNVTGLKDPSPCRASRPPAVLVPLGVTASCCAGAVPDENRIRAITAARVALSGERAMGLSFNGAGVNRRTPAWHPPPQQDTLRIGPGGTPSPRTWEHHDARTEGDCATTTGMADRIALYVGFCRLDPHIRSVAGERAACVLPYGIEA